MIELRDLNISYQKKTLIKSKRICIPENKVTLMKGLSGSGKTSLLYRLGIISKDCRYEYIYHNQDLIKFSHYQKSQIRRYQIGYVFQDFCLFEYMTIEQCLEYYSKLADIKMKDYDFILKTVHLKNPLTQVIETLSGGEKQRLAIACALLKNPDLLILDEPTSALDEINERSVFEILQELTLAKRCTVIIASHSYIADEYADMIYEVKDQKLTCIKECIEEEQCVHEKKLTHSFEFVKYYLKKVFSNNIYMNVIMIFILIFGCIGTLSVQNMIHQSVNDIDKKINKISDHQFMIMGNDVKRGYFDEGSAVSSSLIEELKNNDEVKNIYPFYQLHVKINGKDVQVYPIFPENKSPSVLYSTFNKEQRVFPSYHTVFELLMNDSFQPVFTDFMFNRSVKVSQEVPVGGIMPVGKTVGYTSYLDYVLMDYEIIEDLAKKAGVKPSRSCYVVFGKEIESIDRIMTYVREEKENNSVNFMTQFQETHLLIEAKYRTTRILYIEEFFTLMLSILLFAFLSFWLMKKRETELAILKANGMSFKEMTMLLLADSMIKIVAAITVSTFLGIIIKLLNLYVLSLSDMIHCFMILGLSTFIASFIISIMISCYINPEKVFRN